MNAQISQTTFVDSFWFGGRFASATGEATRAAVGAFQCAWRESSKQVVRARAMEMMADINGHTLKDIGAPEWLIAGSVERQDAHRLHLLALYYS